MSNVTLICWSFTLRAIENILNWLTDMGYDQNYALGGLYCPNFQKSCYSSQDQG